MKIDANFVVSPDRIFGWGTRLLWGWALVQSALILWMVVDGAISRAQTARLDARHAALAARQRALPAIAVADLPDMRAVRAQVQRVNQMEDARRKPALQVLATLEDAAPEGGVVSRFEYGRPPGVAMLQGMARNAEWVTSFVANLEKLADYEQVQLAQLTDQTSGEYRVRFEIRLKSAAGGGA